MTTMTMLAMTVLADGPRNTGPDFGKASPLGLVVVVLLLIGTFLLVFSMNRHLRKLPASFSGETTEAGTEDTEAGAGAVGDSEAVESGKSPQDPGGQQAG